MKTVSILLCVFVLVYSSGISEGWLQKKEVNITNEMTLNEVVTVHCKSGDDDLGARILQKGETYSFKFRENVFPITLFFCHFQWKSDTLGVTVSKRFDIYDTRKEATSECDHCFWRLYEDLLCRWVDDKHPFKCFAYDKEKSSASLRA